MRLRQVASASPSDFLSLSLTDPGPLLLALQRAESFSAGTGNLPTFQSQ